MIVRIPDSGRHGEQVSKLSVSKESQFGQSCARGPPGWLRGTPRSPWQRGRLHGENVSKQPRLPSGGRQQRRCRQETTVAAAPPGLGPGQRRREPKSIHGKEKGAGPRRRRGETRRLGIPPRSRKSRYARPTRARGVRGHVRSPVWRRNLKKTKNASGPPQYRAGGARLSCEGGRCSGRSPGPGFISKLCRQFLARGRCLRGVCVKLSSELERD
ncbi:hypothetical protein SKAU_G00362450 [Synaphobranchus kaupii]|uniref:Uncharacterized protein n=1 Tax=Synaphobranchus kaupii TaxID=118154 RepID=A0A9Q1EIK8_SYNKA|nr:hypothetical protein SKAU_G00362450 [Synaphobranchus kaupii]